VTAQIAASATWAENDFFSGLRHLADIGETNWRQVHSLAFTDRKDSP
jgi:hypothetical protein